MPQFNWASLTGSGFDLNATFRPSLLARSNRLIT